MSAVDPVDALFSGSPEIGRTDALLVQRGGEVVLERYGDDVDASTTLRSWSMAKSMLHAVVGMLVAEGRLDARRPRAGGGVGRPGRTRATASPCAACSRCARAWSGSRST